MRRFLLAVGCLPLLLATAAAENWPAWRGPQGSGHAADHGFPLRWSRTAEGEEQNIAWRVALPAGGNSTPIVWQNQVLVTCPSDEGRVRSLLSFDRQSGALRWSRSVQYEQPEATHPTNPQCSSSPVTDGERVVVWHGSAGVHAYGLDGEPLWSKSLGKFAHHWGTASSPVIFEDLVLLNCGPGLQAFVVALNKQTGNEVWRQQLPDMTSKKIDDFHGSWSTPVIVSSADGQPRMLLSLPQRLVALNPRDGSLIWESTGLGPLVYTSPLVTDEVVVAMSGYHGPALAFRRGGKGDVTESHRLWQHVGREDVPQRVGSGIIVKDHIYILNEPGIAWCMELKTGEVKWKQRLGRENPKCWTSMCYADGRLYVINTQGTTFVLEADPEQCEVLAENPVGELTRASLAFSAGDIFIRTYGHLICVRAPADGAGR